VCVSDGLGEIPVVSDLTHELRRDGDVLLISKRCASLPPLRALLCFASKYGLSGDGRYGWDHAAMVYRDRMSNVPMLLEGEGAGVTLRTFEERLMQGTDHQEVLLLPLRGVESTTVDGDQPRLASFVQELGLVRSRDGYDGQGSCCQNNWALYRDLRLSAHARSASIDKARVDVAGESSMCHFGAPLVATALQRLGVLDPRVDPASVTPVVLPDVPLQYPALFGRPVTIRSR